MVRQETVEQNDGSHLSRIFNDNGSLRWEQVNYNNGSTVARFYHENGSISLEQARVDNRPHGVTREWHPNRVLAHETPYDHGVIDGVEKYWNDQGELYDSFEIKKGTGVRRDWRPDSDNRWFLNSEITFVDGKMTGRHLAYWDGGRTAIESYSISDRDVSKKRYFEACETDPTLPRYDWRPPLPRAKIPRLKRRRKPLEPPEVADALPLRLLEGPDVREALVWLEESREPSRSLGAANSVPVFASQDESLDFIKKLYSLGAVAVHAVEIDGGPDEDQNSGKLVVELPQDTQCRKKLLQFSNRLARGHGFEPDPDGGQRYIFMMLD